MAKYRFTLSIGLGDGYDEIMDIDNDISDEEREARWTKWSNNYLYGGIEKIDD